MANEAFCDGHSAALAFFGGVPVSILYDNTTIAVARIVLAESSKFDRTAMFTVCDLVEIDILVCDAPPPEHLARAMRDAGIELVTV